MYSVIKRLADENGKTFADISRGTGIAETTLSNMKKRGTTLSFDNAVKVAQFFGVPVESLKGDSNVQVG